MFVCLPFKKLFFVIKKKNKENTKIGSYFLKLFSILKKGTRKIRKTPLVHSFFFLVFFFFFSKKHKEQENFSENTIFCVIYVFKDRS